MADGTVKIDVEIPINKVKSDAKQIDDTLEKLGKNTGKDMDTSFKNEAKKVKDEAKSTSDAIDKTLGKNHKAKITADNSDAKRKANEAKKDLDKIPKKHNTKMDADNSDAKRKAEETKRKTNEVPKKHNTDFDAHDHTAGIFNNIKRHFDSVNSEAKKTHSIFGQVFSANLISNAAVGALGAVKGAIGGVIGEAKQYALEQQTMNATWLTLTNNATKGKAMVDQINDMAAAAQNSTHMVDQLSQKFYAINNNAEQTGKLTKAVLTLQDAFGQSDAAVENFGTQFAQMMANGKVSAADMLSIVNVFPKLKPMLLDYEKQVQHSSNLTMSQMSELMRKGEISSNDMINVLIKAGEKYKNATGNFTATIPGMVRTVKTQIPRFLNAIETPIQNAKNPLYGAVSKWATDKNTEKQFTSLGKTVSDGMSKILHGLGMEKQIDVTKGLNNALKGLNNTLKGVFDWLGNNIGTIKEIAKSVGSIAFQIGKNVWHSFASIIESIGRMFGITSKNAKGSSGALKTIASALDGFSKNKAAVKAVSDAIVAIAVVKGLDKVGGGIFAIGEKGYGAYKKIKALRAGLKGLELAKDASKAEKAWAKAGGLITKSFKGIRTGIRGLGKGFKYLGKGVATASKELGGKFVQQLKLVGKGIKGLGKGLMKAAKAIGREAISAGKFLGEQVTKGFNSSIKLTKGLFGKGDGAGMLNGSLRSLKSAGGFKGLSTAGKVATGASIAGIAADVGYNGIYKAFKDRNSATKRSQDIGKGIGAGIGGGIGLWFGGPMGAAIGAKIGGIVGKWGGQAVDKFTKGWQRNKPPKKFWSLENLGWSTHDTFKKIGKWGSDIGKKFGQGLKNGKSFVKKNSKELALTAVNPILGIPALLYKNNPKFKKWADGVGKNIKAGLKTGTKAVNSFNKSVSKNFKSAWDNAYKHSSKGTRQIMRSVEKFGKNYVKVNNKANQDTIKNFSSFSTRLKKNHGDLFKTIGQTAKKQFDIEKRRWSSSWKNIKSTTQGIWKGINQNASSMYDKLNKLTHGGLDKVFGGFKNFGKNIKDFWDGLWRGIRKTFDDTIKGIQDAASNVGKFFTGKLKVGNIHLADGTDWKDKYGYPAILNDGHDSPSTGNREGILNPDGTIEVVNGTNVRRWILPGQDVIKASDMAKMFGVRHLAKGTLNGNTITVNTNADNLLKQIPSGLLKIADLMGDANDTNSDVLKYIKEDYKRKKKRDSEAKSSDDKKEPLKITIDNKKRKGSVLVDKGLLYGARKETGQETWINEKIFKKLMSYAKVTPDKINKNGTVRYRELPARKVGKDRYSVDSHWLTGQKTDTGKREIINHETLERLIAATRQERKYKIKKKKKKRKKINRKTSSRRSYSSSSSRSRISRASSREYSASSVRSKVSASVSGLKSIRSLSKALKDIKGTRKVKVKVSTSGTKMLKTLSSQLKKATKKHKVKVSVSGTKELKRLVSQTKTIRSALSKLTSSAKKNKFGEEISDQAKKAVKSLKGKGNFAKEFESLTKKFEKDLKSMSKNSDKHFKDMWSDMKKTSSNNEKAIEHSTNEFGDSFTRKFTLIQRGIHSSFGKFWTSMRSSARKGLNDVIDVLNTGISRINTVVADFGGNKNAVSRVRRLATGTGALNGTRRPITELNTPAILNDGSDSPETGNKETIWDTRNDTFGVVQGRNTPVILQPWHEVLNASESRDLGFTHYASGSGALKKLYDQAKKYWKQPTKTGKGQFGNINGLSGAINDIAQGANKLATKQAVNWWSQLWSMVQSKVNDSTGNVSGLLKEAVKVSKGHRYVWGAKGPDVFDCSGLVQYAASKLGIALTAPSGNQYAQVEHIPRSEIRQNDLVFYGPGGNEHVGIVRDRNTYWSAHSPSSHPNIGYDSIDSAPAHPILFGRIRGYKPKDKKDDDVKADTKLQKQIKKKVGKGFWQTIKKIADKFGDTSLPNVSGSAKAWTSYIKRAAEKMHVNLTSSDLAQILKVIQGESGGNAKSINLWDSNAKAGHPSKGLIQFIDSSFDKYAMLGHHNIWNGYDQLLAMFNDATWRRDLTTGGWGPLGPRRFARGGIVSQPEVVQVAEAGHPETIIPWDPAQRERAYALMQATLANFKAQDGQAQKFGQAQQAVDLTKTNAEIEAINAKFDEALAALGILTSQNDVIQVNNYLDKNKIGEAMFSVMKRLNMRSTRNSRYNISGH